MTEEAVLQIPQRLDPANLDPNDFCSSGLRVHSVADLFPIMEGNEFDGLCENIATRGLHNPIVVLNGVLLDGRNRLRACAARGIQPAFADYTWLKNREDEWIISQNMHRRSLTPDQRAALLATYYDWVRVHQMERLAKLAGGAQGLEGGRGKKKTLLAKSPEGFSAVPPIDTRAEIAQKAEVSDHKAKQVIFVAKNQPELLDAVVAGKTTLREAEKAARRRLPGAQSTATDEPQTLIATPVVNKRQRILRKAGKDRTMYSLSHIRGTCLGLLKLDVAGFTAEEGKIWAASARDSAKVLRRFGAKIIDEATAAEGPNGPEA
jgi:hypothetical protein